MMTEKTLENEIRTKINDIFYNAQDHKSIPDKIYHYTKCDALKSIIETKRLWATNIYFLNDKQEFRYTLDLFKELINENKHKPFIENFLNSDIYHQFIENKFNFTEVYVTCFTQSDSEKLSLWRGYAPSGGYAIGFNSHVFKDEFKRFNTQSPYYFGKCIYVKQIQRKHIQSIIDLKALENNEKSYQAFLRSIFYLAPLFKDPSFSEEEEVRLVYFPDLEEYCTERKISHNFKFDIDFWNKKNFFIPIQKYKLKDEPLPVSSIQVGPMEHQELAEKSLKMFLKSQNLEKVEVICSDIPYREF
jgi:hypothetical protein